MGPYQILLRIPVVGTIFYIANCYVYGGDKAAVSGFARPLLWAKALLVPLTISSLLAGVALWQLVRLAVSGIPLTTTVLTAFAKAPGELIVSVVPSLLGFGIGVYALIFALTGQVLHDLETSIEKLKAAKLKREGSSLVINADLAYPLSVLVIALGIGVFQKGNDSICLLIVAWVTFWYSVVVTFEVIGVLFGLGDQSLLEKLGDAQRAARSEAEEASMDGKP